MYNALLQLITLAVAAESFQSVPLSFVGDSSSSCVPPSSSLSMKTDKPYGAWTSPITSKAITAGSVAISSIDVDPNGNLIWLEGRPQEGGRNVLCQYAPDRAEKSDRNGIDITPKDANVRTRVHEYGGSSMIIDKSEQNLYYSEFTTQRLMKMKLGDGASDGEEPNVEAITPDGGRFRFADGVYDEKKKRIVLVREDHEKPEPVNVVNEIATVDANNGDMKVLATGNDFYASPRLSPDGKKLVYVTWNHPNMPWDSTQLFVTDLENLEVGEKTSDHELIAGSDNDTSVMQPLWHPQTGKLFYISDKSGYYNIYREGSDDSVLPMDVNFGYSALGWRLGQQGFDFLPDVRLFAVIQKEGCSRLLVCNVSGAGVATDLE